MQVNKDAMREAPTSKTDCQSVAQAGASAQKKTILAGITPNAEQDYAVTESMGPIYDRSHEHLYGADGGIIRFRQILLAAAYGIQEGIDPPGIDDSIPYHLIRSEETIVQADEDPWSAGADAGESAKPGERIW